MEDDAEHQPNEKRTAGPAVDAEGDGAGVPAGHPHHAVGCELFGDLRAGIAGADDQDRSFPQLSGVAVVAGVDLPGRRPQILCEAGLPRPLVVGHGDDDIVGLEAALPCDHHEPAVLAGQAVHMHAGAHGECEARRVLLEVVTHLVLRGEVVPRGGKRKSGESAEARRGEQPQ